MKVCYTGGAVKDCGSYYSVATNAVELRIWFLTDDILRIRAGFDGDWDEASYSLTMTAWESRTDELMKNCRKRVQSAAAALTDGDRQAVIQGARLKVVIEKAPFRIMVYDKDGSLLHADIPDLAYREDSNHRRIHASQIEADDCFYGFGEKSGEINKAEKYMNMAPGDAMGYNAKETDSLYKHIPFYIRLNRGTKQAVGYFYHNTAECDFNMGREKRNYCYQLGILPKKQQPRINRPELERIWKDTEKILAEHAFVHDHKFPSLQAIVDYRKGLSQRMETLTAQRAEIVKQMRRKDASPELADRRAMLTCRIAELRKEDKIAEGAIKRIQRTRESNRIDRENQERHTNHNRRRDRSRQR